MKNLRDIIACTPSNKKKTKTLRLLLLSRHTPALKCFPKLWKWDTDGIIKFTKKSQELLFSIRNKHEQRPASAAPLSTAASRNGRE